MRPTFKITIFLCCAHIAVQYYSAYFSGDFHNILVRSLRGNLFSLAVFLLFWFQCPVKRHRTMNALGVKQTRKTGLCGSPTISETISQLDVPSCMQSGMFTFAAILGFWEISRTLCGTLALSECARMRVCVYLFVWLTHEHQRQQCDENDRGRFMVVFSRTFAFTDEYCLTFQRRQFSSDGHVNARLRMRVYRRESVSASEAFISKWLATSRHQFEKWLHVCILTSRKQKIEKMSLERAVRAKVSHQTEQSEQVIVQFGPSEKYKHQSAPTESY